MEEQVIINKTEKPNSFETGKPGARWKIYFNTAYDLKMQIEGLRAQGFEIESEEKTKVIELLKEFQKASKEDQDAMIKGLEKNSKEKK